MFWFIRYWLLNICNHISDALLPPPAPTILRLWLLLTNNYLFVFTDGNLAEVCRLSPQRRSPVLSRKNRESTFFPLGDTLSNAIHVLPPPPPPRRHSYGCVTRSCPTNAWRAPKNCGGGYCCPYWIKTDQHATSISKRECPQLCCLVRYPGGIPHDGLYREAPPKGVPFSVSGYIIG